MAETFSHKSNARRAARKALGADAKEGVHYKLSTGKDGRIGFNRIGGPDARSRTRPAKAERARTMPRDVKPTPPADKVVRVKSEAKRKGKPVRRPAVSKAKSNVASVPGAWLDRMLAMLQSPKGATAAEVAKAFNWEEHTARARISVGPRSRNMRAERVREERNGNMVSVYRVTEQLPLGEKREALGVLYSRPERVRKPKAKAA